MITADTGFLPRCWFANASAALEAEFNALKSPDGYLPYDTVTSTQRQHISTQAKALADALDGIDPALGL